MGNVCFGCREVIQVSPQECNDDYGRMHGEDGYETMNWDCIEGRKEGEERSNERDGEKSVLKECNNDEMRMHREDGYKTMNWDCLEGRKEGEERSNERDGEKSVHKECKSNNDYVRMQREEECETMDCSGDRKEGEERSNGRDGEKSVHKECNNDEMRMNREDGYKTMNWDCIEERKEGEERSNERDGEKNLLKEKNDYSTVFNNDAHYANRSEEEEVVHSVESVEKTCDSSMEKKSTAVEKLLTNDESTGSDDTDKVDVVGNLEFVRSNGDEQAKALGLLSLLPAELRCLVYSKVMLVDRVMAADKWPDSEMVAYFEKNRILVESVIMDVREDYDWDEADDDDDNDNAESIREFYCISIGFHCPNWTYVEQYELPEDILPLVEDELTWHQNFDESRDYWSKYSRWKGCARMDEEREYHFRLGCEPYLFSTFKLVVVKELNVKSVSSRGLVDLVQPMNVIHMAEESTVLLKWVAPDRLPILPTNMTHWISWLGALSRPPNTLKIETNTCTDDPIDCNYCGVLSMPKELFDIPTVKKAGRIGMTCFRSDIGLQQLSSLEATVFVLHTRHELGSTMLTLDDLIIFFGEKMKEWLKNPNKDFRYEVQSFERPQDYQVEYKKLLQAATEHLTPTHFRVYREYCPQMENEYCKDALSIRCLQTERWLCLRNFTKLRVKPERDVLRDVGECECGRVVTVSEWPIPI